MTNTTRTAATGLATLAAIALIFIGGLVIGRLDHADSVPADGCADALADVVEAVETTWSTASEAVDRAQAAVGQPDVVACLETHN